jgi:hypothetical protein
VIEPNESDRSGATNEPAAGETPPPFLQDDLTDLLVPATPRLVVITERRWMAPYQSLEQGELGHRLQAAREHTVAFALWLRALALYRSVFNGVFEWGEELPLETIRALNLRADLLGLAGSSSKPALDALISGYYWAAFGQIRNLLETWRRVAFVRLRPEEAVQWFVLPVESPIGADGQSRKGRKALRFETIRAAFEDASDADRGVFDTVNAGIAHLHGGAHPSAEGMMQLRTEHEDRRVFGPTYDRRLCAFGLKWALTAHVVLLQELNRLRPQQCEWIAAYNEFFDRGVAWQLRSNAKIGDKPTEIAD